MFPKAFRVVQFNLHKVQHKRKCLWMVWVYFHRVRKCKTSVRVYLISSIKNSEPDISNICTSECLTTMLSCKDDCDTNATCVVECNYTGSMCLNGNVHFLCFLICRTKALKYSDCPCMQNCQQGCEGCPNPICLCKDPLHEPDYLICKEHYETLFLTCSKDCNNSYDCILECSRKLDADLTKCPCQSGCLGKDLSFVWKEIPLRICSDLNSLSRWLPVRWLSVPSGNYHWLISTDNGASRAEIDFSAKYLLGRSSTTTS